MLNSSGQDCWTAGSALTHEMWSSPSAFIRAVKPTGNIPPVTGPDSSVVRDDGLERGQRVKFAFGPGNDVSGPADALPD